MKSTMSKQLSILLIAIMLAASAQAAETSISYPFSFWGEGRAGGDRSLVTGRFEQGVKVMEYNGWSFIPFVAMGATKDSNPSEYWNNELIPEAGFKVAHPFKIVKDGWGNVNIGARYRKENYLNTIIKGPEAVEVFVQVGFGGDWKH